MILLELSLFKLLTWSNIMCSISTLASPKIAHGNGYCSFAQNVIITSMNFQMKHQLQMPNLVPRLPNINSSNLLECMNSSRLELAWVNSSISSCGTNTKKLLSWLEWVQVHSGPLKSSWSWFKLTSESAWFLLLTVCHTSQIASEQKSIDAHTILIALEVKLPVQ